MINVSMHLRPNDCKDEYFFSIDGQAGRYLSKGGDLVRNFPQSTDREGHPRVVVERRDFIYWGLREVREQVSFSGDLKRFARRHVNGAGGREVAKDGGCCFLVANVALRRDIGERDCVCPGQ